MFKKLILSILLMLSLVSVNHLQALADTTFYGNNATVPVIGLNKGYYVLVGGLSAGDVVEVSSKTNITTLYLHYEILTQTPTYFRTPNIGFYCPDSQGCRVPYLGGAPAYTIYKTDIMYPTQFTATWLCPLSATTYYVKYANGFQDSTINYNWPGSSLAGLVGNFFISLSGNVTTSPLGDHYNVSYNLKAGDTNAVDNAIGFINLVASVQTCRIIIGGH